MAKAVIGLGFGDEGKGCTTSWLSSLAPDGVVVRYSGGAQAAHHVLVREYYASSNGPDAVHTFEDNFSHIYASFGSAVHNGWDTYLHSDVVVEPGAIMREFDLLCDKLPRHPEVPQMVIHTDCPLVTPLDIAWNLSDMDNMGHGSCGCGIYATKQRQDEGWPITVGDVRFPDVLAKKVALLQGYYDMPWHDPADFMEECLWLRDNVDIVPDYLSGGKQEVILEGTQGLLLDEDIGFMPHCTPSNVGLNGIPREFDYLDVYYVTRAYATRHGNGPMMSPGILGFDLLDSEHEINSENDRQGRFRKSILNVDLLEYGLYKDDTQRADAKTLVVTCTEQMCDWLFWYDGEVVQCANEVNFCLALQDILNMDHLVICNDHNFRRVV